MNLNWLIQPQSVQTHRRAEDGKGARADGALPSVTEWRSYVRRAALVALILALACRAVWALDRPVR